MIQHKKILFFVFFLLFVLSFYFLFLRTVSISNADTQQEIEKRNKQIEELERQIQEYQKQIDTSGAKARTLSGEISRLDANINKLQLEIKSLAVVIDQTNLEIRGTQEEILTAQEKIEIHRRGLIHYLQSLYEVDQENLIEVLLKNGQLSDFFNNLKNLQDTQEQVQHSIDQIRGLKVDLENKEVTLEDKRKDLEGLKHLQVSEKSNLDVTKNSKNQLLNQTKGEEKRFEKLVQDSKQDINRIKEQVFYLQQNGISVEDAIKYGQLAALATGIRPAFLIAILEVETGLGRNVGTGNWQKDMYECYLKLKKASRAESEKAAFFKIVEKLGLNPDTVKVSREPNYGCGGALGPAQFLPTTWLAYEDAVSRLTGHNPANPWNLEDAFTGAAIKLANGGAKSKNTVGEIAAAKGYISGNAKCISYICNYYANLVQSKARIIENNL